MIIPLQRLAILSLEAVLTALLVLVLFRARTRLGLSPLYVTLGVFQPIQVLLVSSVYVEVLPGLLISPGSAVMFSASLFAVLLVYILEDAVEARKVIYGILAANLTMSVFLYLAGLHLADPGVHNYLALPQEIFSRNARVMLAGTIFLFADVILVIVVYELLARRLRRRMFLCIYLTLAAVLAFDSFGFFTAAFLGRPEYGSMLRSALVGKLGMALFYAAALTAYLRWFESGPRDEKGQQPLPDLFQALTYRQRYEAERHRAAAALRESEERLRLALEAANQGLYDLNVVTGEAQVSPEYATMLGYDPAEFRETNDAWVARLHPDDREPVAAVYRDYIAGRIPAYQVEFRQRTRSGDWKWILSLGRIQARDAQGRPLRMLGTHTDITARKLAEEALRESEERFRTVVQNVQAVIYILDRDGVFELSEGMGLQALGLEPGEVVGRSALEMYRDYPVIVAALERALAGDETRAVFDVGESAFDTVMTPRLDADGKVTGVIGLATDITAQRRAEHEKERLQAQLLHAQKMESVGRLAGGVAHDFNNMLSAIIGHTELAMLQDGPDDPVQSHLREIEAAATRSADLVRQLLAFARKQTVTPRILDLDATIARMVGMLQRLIGEGVELVWQPGSAPWLVSIDPSQVDQLLTNLCVNARDAISGVGRVTIETGCRTVDADDCRDQPEFTPGQYVVLTVSDNGSGASPEVVERMFEPFFTTKDVGRGTGLGLATVYGIVKQNGGFIDVRSDPGFGTAIGIFLPRSAGAEAPAATTSARTPTGAGETLLLVEDDLALLNVTRTMLQRLGYTVLAAATPREALDLAADHGDLIRLLVTDVVMPQMNGRELAERIGELRPGLRCLFMSGYTADVIAHHGVVDDSVAFLQKPFSLEELGRRVRETLDGA